MARLRKMSRWFWVILGALVVLGGMWVSDIFIPWMPKWLRFAAIVVVLLSNIYTFRRLWKASDHPAFHRDPARPDFDPTSAQEKPLNRQNDVQQVP